MRPSPIQREEKHKLTLVTNQEELEELLAGAGRPDVPYVAPGNFCVTSELKKWRRGRPDSQAPAAT